ncbi:MAG: NAD-dependent epimerase/dehydratase family protein, partial [Paracoccaceae bacterium]|nr:NAD-dependent epimerase/dehydratase family protein [Paracoccaceae bacterium]
MDKTPNILILGADGFIGRHLAYHFRSRGWRVLAQARNTARLSAMGFETLKLDLTSPKAATPEFW